MVVALMLVESYQPTRCGESGRRCEEAQVGASREYQSPVTETMHARTAQSFADDAATKLGPIPGLKDVAIWMLQEVTRP